MSKKKDDVQPHQVVGKQILYNVKKFNHILRNLILKSNDHYDCCEEKAFKILLKNSKKTNE